MFERKRVIGHSLSAPYERKNWRKIMVTVFQLSLRPGLLLNPLTFYSLRKIVCTIMAQIVRSLFPTNRITGACAQIRRLGALPGGGADAGGIGNMRRHSRTGYPLGDEDFITRLEPLLSRPLKKV